ncbi:MAG: hypothetical protein ABIJ08_01725 [Nanoarchaeota archaeon]
MNKVNLIILVIITLIIASFMDDISKIGSRDKINYEKKEDSIKVIRVFEDYIFAGENCNIELAENLISKKSKEIIHFTCENFKAEVECYKNIEYEIKTKDNTAMLYLTPFSHNVENPFFFIKEESKWKIDFYKMANGIAMKGNSCNSGWNWKNDKIKKEFCSYFDECPE